MVDWDGVPVEGSAPECEVLEKYGEVGIIKTVVSDGYCWKQLMLLKRDNERPRMIS